MDMFRRVGRPLVALLLVAFFVLFMVVPLYTVVREGLRPSYIVEVLRNPIYREGLWNSLVLAVLTTGATFLVALPFALMADRYDFPGKSLVNALILVPMILPPFVGALGFVQIFGQYGVLNSLLGVIGLVQEGQGPDWLGRGRLGVVVVTEVLHLYPILYLNLATALANVDPTLHEAAKNLGAGGWTRFQRITVPLIRPGIFAGGTIVFIWGFTELGTPLMLGYHRVAAVQVFNGVTELESNPLPYSLVVILLVVSGGLYVLSRVLFGKETTAGLSRGGPGAHSKVLRGWGRWLPIAAFLALTFVAALPHLSVILLSVARNWYHTIVPDVYTLRHFSEALSHDMVVPSIVRSLSYSVAAMVVCVIAGLAVALLTTRWKLPGWQIMDIMSMLPLAVPGIILAFGYLGMATRYDSLRAIFDPIRNPTLLLILAYAMRRLPYVVRAASAGLQQTPVELELAAANLGASPFLTLRRIVAPLIAANLIAGALFAFSFSMLEVSDSLILAQKAEYYPITRALYELAQILGSGPYVACALGVWAMAFLGATLAVSALLLGKRLGALFRV